MEYALAFDLLVEVDTSDSDDAVEVAQQLVDNADIWSAILNAFGSHRVAIPNADLIITDIAVQDPTPQAT
ncbi:MAG: hypothetical protein AMXMBFR23_18720 [Chloroflexota bacterium]